ncbi:proline iminopeptidase [Bacillus mycoides]|nr:proline iminopeptidase [Bacillus mycoides]MBE7149784.1 proline iminopeptidase [Bacillus mycoides]QWG33572.1 proline iminopeptidase [Bacillus mycoides]
MINYMLKDGERYLDISDLVIYENSAHFPDIEETDNVCETIIEFLEI